jgi:hypothetical protein
MMIETAQWADDSGLSIHAIVDGIKWQCIRMDEQSELQREVQSWIDGGGVPDPYVPPEPVPPEPTAEQSVLYDHENRIRAQEGAPPLSMADFVQRMRL